MQPSAISDKTLREAVDPTQFSLSMPPSAVQPLKVSNSTRSPNESGKREASSRTLLCGLFLPVLIFITLMIFLDKARDHQNEYDPYDDKQLQKQIAERKKSKLLQLEYTAATQLKEGLN